VPDQLAVMVVEDNLDISGTDRRSTLRWRLRSGACCGSGEEAMTLLLGNPRHYRALVTRYQPERPHGQLACRDAMREIDRFFRPFMIWTAIALTIFDKSCVNEFVVSFSIVSVDIAPPRGPKLQHDS
jgi:hypothetical protein